MSELFELGMWQVAFWWLVGTVVVASVWVVLAGQHRTVWTDRAAARWAWHWVSGGPLETERSMVVEVPRRLLVGAARTTAAAAVVAALYHQSGTPWGSDLGTLAAVGFGGVAVLVVGTLLIIWAAVRVYHQLRWVRPLHLALCHVAGWPEDKRPGSWIRVPRERAEGDDGVIVVMPPDWEPREAKKEAVLEIVKAKLDLHDVTATWVTAGRHSYLQVRPREPMPKVVRFADPKVRRLVEEAKPSAPLFGLTRGGKPVFVDLDSDSPHLLLSAGTGAGKSWTLHMLAAQLMAHGASLAVLDHKRHSHRWVRHLEGEGIIHYAADIADIHETLIRLGEEADRRNRAWDHVDIDNTGAPTYPRLIILCEELNATMHLLKSYWREIRPRGNSDLSGPAVRAMRNILYMGRAVKVHVFAVAQMAIANDVGGPAARENFAVRLFATTWTRNNWEMLAPQVPWQRATGHKGRGFVVRGDQAIETQFVLMTEHEARELVMANRDVRVRPPEDVAGRADASPLGDSPRHVAEPRHVETAPKPVTLWRASRDKGVGIVPLTYAALSKARDRDRAKGLFPKPVVEDPSRPLYDPRDLRRWFELRSQRSSVDAASAEERQRSSDDDEVVVGAGGAAGREPGGR